MTKTPFRIGVLGMTHDHIWSNLDDVKNCPDTELVAAADPHQELREKFEELYGCPVYDDYAAVLDGESLDGVFVFADNEKGAELVEMAAARRLHAMVEKPMAASLAGAERMLTAAKKAGTRLMINWPFAWWPQMQHALKLVADGVLGDIWQVKYRAAHAGPAELGCSEYFCDWLFDAERNGGGALIDYCCYGALLARAILGSPTSVSGVKGNLTKRDLPVEDNAVIVMQYPHAIAVSEGSWSQIGNLSSYVTWIYGTRGTLMMEPRAGGRLMLADETSPDGREIECPEPDAAHRSAASHFVHAAQTDESLLTLCDPAIGRDAQSILDAAKQSSETGQSLAPLTE